ncbi:hypothetical protein Q4566_00060 [Tamlana sp. 2_MG-2023]|uniref:hypothetical protein n=1 Tax=unclassified Tamlana TaxID=2614803 RepID=UPI0026E20A5F|nr:MULTISPECIES: hypothetical protein [unclassified Tamlana]MDO6758574.1 hypothetical protein [Tamlana sp. 2_MG-2023]MDO6789273.1 hypothetical protein [Tamlana sp. 1_MG-2023]
MFTNLTYKQKLCGVGLLAVLLFFTANKRSFKVTKQAYIQSSKLEEKLNYINDSNSNVSDLQNELDLYDRIIGVQGVQPEDVQQSVLDFTTEFINVDVFGMEEMHFSESNGFKIITNQLILEGDYNSLIEVIYEFEKKFEFSSIVSVSFQKEKEYLTRKNKLRVKIIFQNYEKIN